MNFFNDKNRFVMDYLSKIFNQTGRNHLPNESIRKLVNQTIDKELSCYYNNATNFFQRRILNQKWEHLIPLVEDYGNWWND